MAEDRPVSITINRNPDAAPAPTDSTLADARQATRDARARLSETVEQQKAAPAVPDAPELPPYEPDEDLESVEVQLPNGLLVEFGPPRDVSLTMRIIKILGDNASSDLIGGVYRILLSVRSVNGKPVTPITNSIEAEKLANQLGDAGIDILVMVSKTHWKPIRLSQLPVIKKNQRK